MCMHNYVFIFRRFIVTEVKVLGGMEELEMKFKNLVEPVTLMSDVIIVVKLVHFHRHHSLFMVITLCSCYV